ncbi:hypothetical protein CY652_15090 [Burkholderia sp. WAC0059]|uniref:hypothetical protein n=1 Tax=Burkholderia sp. WAC0059 TaxID=2066022 RepID=UPI000C7F6627|nr:hypothetical protein [Burkholderia sp. WAC0059]PLZ01694.1 hypothetical protein CY652_15090 [Burkholderia sp. WAC0059]
MSDWLPDYLIREQTAVGALVAFGLLRIIAAAVARTQGWRIATVERVFIGLAALYCLPQVPGLFMHPHVPYALAAIEGKAAGCAIALFCAPILSHRLGYE